MYAEECDKMAEKVETAKTVEVEMVKYEMLPTFYDNLRKDAQAHHRNHKNGKHPMTAKERKRKRRK